LLVASGLLTMDGWADAAVFGSVTAALAWYMRGLLRPYRGMMLVYAGAMGGMMLVSGIEFGPLGFDLGRAGGTLLLLLRLMMAMVAGMPLLVPFCRYRLQQAVERPLRGLGISRRAVRTVTLTVSLLFRF